jgi:hypothetical protein
MALDQVKNRAASRMAWSMLAVFAVGYAAAPLSVANGNFQRQPGFYLAMVLAFTAFMVVGTVIVAHRPGNAVGWIFSAVGLLSSAAALSMEYAEYAYVTRPGSLPGAGLTAWLAVWSWFPLLGLILVFTPLLFPTGRLLSARWRPVAVVAAVGLAAFTVLVALQPTIRLQNENYTVRNPLGLAGVPDPEGGGVVGRTSRTTTDPTAASTAKHPMNDSSSEPRPGCNQPPSVAQHPPGAAA